MNLSTRIGLAWEVLRGERKSTVATMLPAWKDNQPVYNEIRFETLVKEGWRRNELIFACIDKTAKTSAQVSLQVIRDSDEEPIDNHPIKRLIERPNPHMNEFDFWSSVVIYQQLSGRAIYEKVRSRGGQVVELWPLRPDWVEVIASSQASSGIAAYKYTVPGLDAVLIPPQDVVDFKLWDPLNMYGGWPPAAVAGRVGDVDNAATDYLKLFFQNGGVPPGLLKTSQTLLDVEVENIRRRWRERYGGWQHWAEPAVLDKDASYEKTGFSFTEMGFDVLDARNEARICMVLKVPPILIGAKIGLDRATYSNYGEARKAWWQDDLIPLYVNYTDVLDNSLGYEFGGGVTCGFDFSQVPALQEDRQKVWQIATAALTAGGITVNEFCGEVGLPDKGESGDVYLRSAATLEVPVNGEREEPEESEPEEETEEMDEEETGGSDVEPKRLSVHTDGKAQPPPDAATRRRHERQIEKAMESYFGDQLGRIRNEVRSGNGR